MSVDVWDYATGTWSKEPDLTDWTGLPTAVFVAIAVYTKAVAVNSQAATAPITGGPNAIFANRAKAVEERLGCEVVAVCYTEAEARQAVERHKAAHTQLQAEYEVTEKALGAPIAAELKPAAPSTYPCIGGCGKQLSGGVSYCQPCREALWRKSREADPEL